MIATRVGIMAVTLGALLGGATIFGLDYQRVKAQLHDERKAKAELQARLDYAAETIKLREVEFKTSMEKLKDDLRKKNNLFESQRASNDVATDSLLKHIADLRARLKDADADTARVTAGRASAILGDCAQKYRDMAAEAERLRIKIDGLQTTVKTCMKD